MSLPRHVQDVNLNLDFQSPDEIKPSLKKSFLLTKWIRNIILDSSSRNLFAFLLINLSFAFVELFYGMWTNSLGLISDSFHMLFDCTALLAGLVATVVSKWPPNDQYSYGYVRAEVVAGFINALFLLFIAFFIFAEAIERAFEPPEVKHDRLLVVSVGGFIVNLIGIFAFHHGGHGHSHSHSSCGHSHDHSHGSVHDSHAEHAHKSHHHSSKGSSQIMQGIFLHILADTLGSIGVIVSSVLIDQFGWMQADPVCSMFIAILITLSVYPLMQKSLESLMQRYPRELNVTLPHLIQKITEIKSVTHVLKCHVWTLCTNVHVANARVEVYPGSDLSQIHAVIRSILNEAGIQETFVELVQTD